MAYDGMGGLVAITELHGTTVLTAKTFVWADDDFSQERDSTGHTVTKQFFDYGEQINGTNYYYTFDHLDSVRELVDGSGNVQARYDYDPYGRQTQLTGTLCADFGYANYYVNKTTGLNFATHRVYDPEKGRWLSRDPMDELDDLTEMTAGDNFADFNTYAYVAGSPFNFVDSDGQRKMKPKNPKPDPDPDPPPGHHTNKRPSNWNKHSKKRSGGPEKKDAKMPFRWGQDSSSSCPFNPPPSWLPWLFLPPLFLATM